jgi:Putative zinc-finger
MECEKIQEKFSSLLEGDMDPSEEKTVREHLASCSRCQRDFETFKKTMNWLHSVDEVEAPEGFLTEIYQKIEDRKGMRYRQAWVHRLMRLKLPAQAVAMVAIVFAILYITKMIPTETHREKNVDVARTPPSEVKTDTHLAQQEAKTEKQEIALLSKAPRTKGMEQEKASLSEAKEIEKGAIPKEGEEARDSVAYLPKAEAPQAKDAEKAESPTSKPGKIGKVVTSESSAFLTAKPSQEIILRVQDQEKAISQLQSLVKEFGGEIVRQEGYIVLAYLPTGSYWPFERKLEGMASPQKAEPAAPQQVAPRAPRISRGVKEEESVRKEREMGRPMADQAGRIAVRILVVKE